MRRIFGFSFLVLMTLGFRTYSDVKWAISISDPKVFVRFCSSYLISANDVPVGDVLYGTSPSFNTVVQSVYDNINSVAQSYVQLVDIGDTDYNAAIHGERVIDVCQASAAGVSTGEAKFSLSNGRIGGCNVSLTAETFSGTKKFVATLTHELGHCLGLDHPQTVTRALMSYFADENLIRLDVDDKMGLIHLYPTDWQSAQEEATWGLTCDTR